MKVEKEDKIKVEEKDWLNLAWHYFQQHAQQRISYFNFFVIFSTILMTAYTGSFQNSIKVPYLGLFIGLIQSFVSFIFIKIDFRNKFLTKNAENILKNIENEFDKSDGRLFSLFYNEAINTKKLKETGKKTFFTRQWTHGESYLLFYSVFGFIGILMTVFAFFRMNATNTQTSTNNYYNYEIFKK